MANTEIYKILIDYIQKDNDWKEVITKQVNSIEAQTKLTNGRLLKAENTISKLDMAALNKGVTSATNWKWIMGILTFIQFIVVTAFYFVIDWIKSRYF